MRIKRIEIYGFKSFADKTEIELGAGLTAVVGPNGSGKSNLAEAVKWVLGEQSARVLRGHRMDDIIFSGTARRKGVGYAEVSLVFDNSGEELPLDYTEVVITRRVYRSGEGEYLINRKTCRLRDITELFLDTGVGKDSYSFVGQGRIEEILNADPRQRRGIFEEAAGISRYKLRKRETESRLDEVRSNLRRVTDIEAELDMQLAPLAEEAERAVAYLKLQSQRRTWERELLLYEIGLAQRQTLSIKNQLEKAKDEMMSQENRLSVLEAARTDLSLRHAALLGEINKLESDLRITDANHSQIAERATEVESDLPDAFLILEQHRKELATARRRAEVTEKELAEKSLELAAVEDSLAECKAQLSSVNDNSAGDELAVTIHDLTQARVKNTEQIASLRVQCDSEATYIERLKQTSLEVVQEHERVSASLKEKEEERASLLILREETRAILAELEKKRDATLEGLEDLRRRRTAAEDSIKASESTLYALHRRLEGLRQAEDQQEGLTRGAKHVLALNLPGVRGAVASHIDVLPEHLRAIEISLGNSLSDIIVDDESVAKVAISALKADKMGRATFYPLDVFSPRTSRPVPAGLDNLSGYFGRASDLVKAPAFALPVIKHLLQNVLVVDNLDTAGEVARRTGYGFRIMTSDGDMVMPGGSMAGGSWFGRTSNVLGRRAEIDNIAHEAQALESDLEEQQNLLRSLVADMTTLRQTEVDLQRLLAQQQGKVANCEASLAAVSRECEYLLRQVDSFAESRKERNMEVESKLAQLERLCGELVHHEAEQAALTGRLADLQRDYKADSQARQEHAEWKKNLEVEYAKLGARREILVHMCGELSRDLSETDERCRSIAMQLQQSESRHELLSRQLAAFTARMQVFCDEADSIRRRLAEVQKMRRELQDKERDTEGSVSSCRESLETCRMRLHSLELRQVKVDSEADNLLGRFAALYPTEVFRLSSLANRGEAESHILELDDYIDSLGDVRVASISEAERLRERLAFLATEREDLATASGRLYETISELDKIMAARFTENFAVVQREFSQVAERLFDGGAARISLVDPQMPLETGIEIDVQPPGKRLQNIRLLSGGERALAAVSLLCAVLRVKPTPFCVLDEVDAALDDSNVERLLLVLRELSTHTQFLIVTHTKTTMLAADILYGVTMPEQGVSKVLSVKVAEISKDG